MEIFRQSTSTALVIPQDIVNHIVDQVLLLNFPNTDTFAPPPWNPLFHTLTTISTICQAFVVPIQRQLFSERHLDMSKDYSSYNAVLSRRPHTATYTRTLSLTLYEVEPFGRFNPTPAQSSALTEILRNFTSVRSFIVGGMAPDFAVRWQTISPSLKSSILHVFRLPTLESLHLTTINNFDLLDLSPSTPTQTLILSRVTGFEDDSASSLQRTPAAAENVTGYVTLIVDGINVTAWDQIVKIFPFSILHLEVNYPENPSCELIDNDYYSWRSLWLIHDPDINLSRLPSLLAFKVKVWHTDTRGRETSLLQMLRSVGEVSEIRDIDFTILIFHPTGLPGACAGLDAALSQPKYRKLRRFSLHIMCIPMSPPSILQATGSRSLEDYYRRQLPNLTSRGALSLTVTMSDDLYTY